MGREPRTHGILRRANVEIKTATNGEKKTYACLAFVQRPRCSVFDARHLEGQGHGALFRLQLIVSDKDQLRDPTVMDHKEDGKYPTFSRSAAVPRALTAILSVRVRRLLI